MFNCSTLEESLWARSSCCPQFGCRVVGSGTRVRTGCVWPWKPSLSPAPWYLFLLVSRGHWSHLFVLIPRGLSPGRHPCSQVWLTCIERRLGFPGAWFSFPSPCPFLFSLISPFFLYTACSSSPRNCTTCVWSPCWRSLAFSPVLPVCLPCVCKLYVWPFTERYYSLCGVRLSLFLNLYSA